MTFLEARQPDDPRPPSPLLRLWGAVGRGCPWEWCGVAATGIFLGLCALATPLLPTQWGPLFIAAVAFPFLAMMVGNLRKLLLAVIIIDIPFGLDTHLNYREEVASLGSLGGLCISATTIALAALYVLWTARLLAGAEPRSRSILKASLPASLYVALVAASMAVAGDATLAFYEFFTLSQALLLFIYVVGTVRTRGDVLFIVGMLMVALVLEGVVVLVLQAVGQSASIAGISGSVFSTGGGVGRGAGTTGSPNVTASYLAMLLAPSLAVLLAKLGGVHRWLALSALGTGALALLLTFSRGGWLAFGISMAVLCLLAWHRGWLSTWVPLAVGALMLISAFAFQDTVLARLFDEGAAMSRLPLIEISLRMVGSQPLLGIGANNYGTAISEFAGPEFGGEWLYTVHNKYLLVMAETGVAGLLAFLLFLAATLRGGWRLWKSEDRVISLLALGFTAALLGQMAHMAVDIFNNRTQVQMLWLVAGLLAALHRVNGEDHGR